MDEELYQDPRTGQLLRADQVDWSQFDAGPEITQTPWSDIVGGGIDRAGGELLSGFGNMVNAGEDFVTSYDTVDYLTKLLGDVPIKLGAAIGDATGLRGSGARAFGVDPIPLRTNSAIDPEYLGLREQSGGNEIPQSNSQNLFDTPQYFGINELGVGDKLSAWGKQKIANAEDYWGLNNPTNSWLQNQAGRGISGGLSLAAKAPALVNPAIAAALFGGEAGAAKYSELEDMGLSRANAAKAAMIPAIANSAIGFIPMGRAGETLSPFMKETGKKALEFSGFNIGNSAANGLADYQALNRPATQREVLAGRPKYQEPTIKEILTGIRDDVAQGVLLAPFMAGYAKGGKALADKPKPIRDMPGEIVPIDPVADIGESVELKPIELTKPEIIKQENTEFPTSKLPPLVQPDIPIIREGEVVEPGARVEPMPFNNGVEVPRVEEVAKTGEINSSVEKANILNNQGGSIETKPIDAPTTEQVETAKPGFLKRFYDALRGAGVKRPVEYLHRSEIVARPDEMQYKETDAAGNKSGTNEIDRIKEPYDSDKAGVLEVWEPADPAKYGMKPGQVIVGNGHHRLERANVDNIDEPLQVKRYREVDGVSLADARRIFAEHNIIDGKGSFRDNAIYYREYAATHGKDAAVERGRQIGAKSRDSQLLAFRSSDSLFDKTVGNNVNAITPQEAKGIIKATWRDDVSSDDLTIRQEVAMQAIFAERARRQAQADNLTKKDGKARFPEKISEDFADVISRAAVNDFVRVVSSQRVMPGMEYTPAKIGALKELADKRIAKNKAFISTAEKADKNPEAAQRRADEETVNDKRLENALLAKFDEHPEIRKSLEAELAGEGYQEGLPLGFKERLFSNKKPKKSLAKKKGAADNEAGFIRVPSYDQMKAWFLGKIDHPAQYEALRRVIDDEGGNSALLKDATARDPIEAGLEGRLFGADVPIASSLKRGFERGLTRPIWYAMNSPKFEAIWREKRQEWKDRESLGVALGLVGKEYFDVIDKTKVNEALQSARIKADELRNKNQKLVVSDANLKQFGLSDPEIVAYRSFGRMMDEAWNTLGKEIKAAKVYLDPRQVAYIDNYAQNFQNAGPKKLKELLKTTQKRPNPADQAAWENDVDNYFVQKNWERQVDDFFTHNKDEHYAPIHRFGKYTVWADKAGEPSEYYHFETTTERSEAIKNLVNRGFTVKPGEVKPTSDAMLDSMPMDMRLALGELLPNEVTMEGVPRPLPGFKPHMLKAKMIKGYGKDLDRQTAEYLTGMANFVSRIRHSEAIKRGMGDLQPKSIIDPITGERRTVGRPKLYDEAADWLKYVDSNNSEWGALRGAMAHFYLGFGNVRSAALNRTQPWTTVYPELRRYSTTPAKDLREAKAFFKLWDKNEAAAIKKNPELAQALTEAMRDGVISEDFSRNLANLKRTGVSKFGQKPSLFDVNNFSELSMKLFSLAEYKNRGETFVAGWNVKNSLPYEARKQFAETFVDKTQYMYSKLNRPRWARGKLGASLMTFRMFPINYLAQIRDVIKDTSLDKRTKLAILGRFGATMATLGGARALPFGKTLIGAAVLMGYDPQKKLRDTTGNKTLSDIILYGLPFQAGFDVSSAMSPDPIQNVERGAGEAALTTLGGVPMDLFYTRPKKAWRNYDDTGKVSKAIEPILPNSIYNAKAGIDAFRSGSFKDYKGQVLVQNPSLWSKALKTVGFTPSELTSAYEASSSRYNAKAQADAEVAGYNRRIGIAVGNGDMERAIQLGKELMSKGVEPNYDEISRVAGSLQNPVIGDLMNASNRAKIPMLDSINTYGGLRTK